MTDYAALLDEETPKDAPPNPYVALLDAEEGERETRRRQNVLGALNTNPQQYATAREIEKHLAIPAPVAERNFAEAEKRYKISQMDHLLRNNPALARQMEDPEFAKLTHDRAREVGDILNGVGRLSEVKRSRLEQASDALLGGFAKARQSITVMAQQMGLYDGADAEFATRVSNQERVAQRYNAAPDVQAGLERISKAETMGEALQAILEEPLAVFDTTIRSLGASSPALVGAIAGSIVGPLGTAAGAGTGSFAVEFSNTIGDVLQERGVDFRDPYALSRAFNDPALMADAREKAAKRGIAIGAFDALTAGMAGRLLAGAKPTARSIAPRVAGEMAVQAGGGMAGEAAAQAVTGEYKPGEILMEGFAELPSGVVEVRSNWRHARDAAVGRMVEDAGRASSATESAQRLTALIDGVAQEPMLAQAPDVFARAINDAAAEGQEVSEVYLNARQLVTVFNQDPVKAAEALGVGPEALDSALASDGDVAVPVGEFVTALAADEAMRPLVDHARLGVGEMSAAEAREWESQQGEAFRQEAEKVLTKRQEETAFAQSAQEVEDFVLAEMQRAGRFTVEVNRADAALHKAFAVAMADRLGLLPMEFFNRHVLRVTGENVAGQQFDQGTGPFGPRLTDFKSNAQGAIAKLTELRSGEAIGALHHPDIGDIDLVWGEEGKNEHDGYGLAKLARWHPEVLDDLQGVVSSMSVTKRTKNRVQLESAENKGAVRLEWNGAAKHWLLTAFRKTGSGTDTRTDTNGAEGSDGSPSLASDSIVDQKINEFYQGLGGFQTVAPEQIEAYRAEEQWTATGEENGFPVWSNKHIALAAPRDVTDGHDVFYIAPEGARAVKYEIRNPQGEAVGHVVLEMTDGWPTMLLDIETKEDQRGNRYAEHAVAAIVNDAGELGIWHIVPDARSWWDRQGVAPVDQYDGTLTFAEYADARANRENPRGLDQGVGGKVLNQAAYHGSPFLFDKFSLDHIGRGEGAQAFGWGLYFAGKKAVAEYYRRSLSDGSSHQTVYVNGEKLADASPERHAASLLYFNDAREIKALAKRWVKEAAQGDLGMADTAKKSGLSTSEYWGRLNDFVQTHKRKDITVAKGQLYEVEIPEDDQMLQWDKSIDKQPPKVKQALKDAGLWQPLKDNLSDFGSPMNTRGGLKGENIYAYLEWKLGSDEAASKRLNEIGIPGLKYPAGTIAGTGTGNGGHNYVIFDDKAVEILKTFYQNQGARARGSFNPATNTIALLQGADLSTFLHESGHYFLEVMANVAAQPDAPAQIRQDFDALLTWFGVPASPEASAFDTWALMSLEEKRQYHEQFARGFEAYLFEGRAPSLELQGLFSRFRAWLIAVYKSIAALNVELTDEVRGVMDRLVATDEQIATAEAARRFAPIFQTAEQAGMTADEWAAYQGEHQQATDDAAAALQARSVRDMRWLANAKSKKMKELQKTATALRAEVEMEVRADVMAQPVYQVWQFLTGKVEKAKAKPKADPKVLDPTTDSLFVAIAKLGGIDKLEIVQTWGTDPADIKALPRPVFGMPIVRTNDGKSIDDLVQRLGEYGYLPLDTYGRADVRDLEDAFAAELRGDAQYSTQHDYAAEQREPDVFDLENYPHGRLDRETVHLFYGKENEIPGLLDGLGMTAAEGYQPDEVANFFGFTSGDDMMRQIVIAEPPADVIAAETDVRMLERFGDLSSPEAVERAAEKAIHNDVRARFLTRELNALRKATGKANVLLKAARDYAEQRIAGLKVRDAVKSAQHRQAEARSGKAADQAMQKADTEAAAVHKRDQLLNHELARASLRAQDEVQAVLAFLKRFDKPATRKALDPDYRDQIDALLEKFDLRPSVSEKQLAKRKRLADWIDQQTAMGLDPVVDQRLLDDTRRQHYRDATLEELRGLRDTVANIEHLGRLKNRLLTAQRNRNLQAVAAEVAASIHAFGKKRKSTEPIGDPQGFAAVVDLGKKFAAEHRKFASIARQLDGFKDGGPMWEYFVRSMNDAGNREADLRATMSEKLAALFEGLKHVKLTRKEQVMPGVSLSRENMLVMALNWGNEGNRQRLMGGGINAEVQRLTQPQVEAILDRLTKEEWDFVQGVWDLLETNRPAIAEQERRLTGVEPKWVEPSPIVTRHGTYRGGYYPAKYDGNFSTRSNELEALTDLRQQMQGAANRAQTRKGYTQARAEEVTGRPLKLALSTLTQHANEVAHRLAWQDWLIDVNRLLKRPEIDSAIREHYGPQILGQIRETVRDIAVGDIPASTALERGLNHLRTGATIAGLGWNVTTSLLQPLGLSQSIVRIGWAPVVRGLRSFLAHPLRTIDEVESKSKFMEHRGATINREINDVLNRMRSDKMSRVEASYFYMIQAMQKVADMPTWLGRYEKALAAGEDEARAIALADQAVIDAQGAGQLKDLARIQRGSPALRLFTNFYSYFNTTYNLAVERGRATDYGNPLAVGRLAVDYLMLFTVPAVLGTLLKHALRGGDDDEEKLAKKLAREQINYVLGSMVLLREVGGAFTGNFGYEGPAGLRAFGAMQKLVKQVEQGEVDKDLVKSAVNVAGVVGVPGIGQFPSGQVNRTIDGVVAVGEGKAGPQAVLFGPPPKN